MAKFAKWKGFIDQSRDLARGLYALTFKDNMPSEPVTKEWLSTTVSPPTCSFTVVPLPTSGVDPIANNYYAMVGTRCFFRMEASLIISGDAQSTFWLRLPAPAKSIGNARFWGKYYAISNSAIDRVIMVDILVGHPSEWWIRLIAHSETASLGAWPRGSGQLSIEGNYEVHPVWIRTGSFPQLNVTFEGAPGSNFQDFTSGLAADSGDMTINAQAFKYMSLGDWVIVMFDIEVEIGITPPNSLAFNAPRSTSDFGTSDSKIVLVGDWESVVNSYVGETYIAYDRSDFVAGIILGSDTDPEEYQPGETYRIRGVWQYPALP